MLIGRDNDKGLARTQKKLTNPHPEAPKIIRDSRRCSPGTRRIKDYFFIRFLKYAVPNRLSIPLLDSSEWGIDFIYWPRLPVRARLASVPNLAIISNCCAVTLELPERERMLPFGQSLPKHQLTNGRKSVYFPFKTSVMSTESASSIDLSFDNTGSLSKSDTTLNSSLDPPYYDCQYLVRSHLVLCTA